MHIGVVLLLVPLEAGGGVEGGGQLGQAEVLAAVLLMQIGRMEK